ncbi:UNVERIFIED_CONTAM: hypothetical protein Scaly_2291500 [Sesamum calycinum]|uniref:Uncharacterized protein n=1 Tax=Sesamum calycinum TaxID=2727403 RepID=A0AAW2MAW3_9LAMI
MESIRVPNLHWRFRGNETILVDNSRVQILWDVHDWLYNGNHSGVGIFVFRRDADQGEFHSSNLEAEDFGKSFGAVLEEQPSSVGFCHFLYAWRLNKGIFRIQIFSSLSIVCSNDLFL